MGPLEIVQAYGQAGGYVAALIIGLGFGATLESSGFGDSRKLAGQFYLRDMTVLKVMFTAIIVASVLIFFCSSLGLLDFDLVWVNPTYLAPLILGGLIMGVGFIIGGFCPGTSMVGAATLKIDALVFVVGVILGTFLFGESVGNFEQFFNSSHLGRFTVFHWWGVDAGLAVIALVLLALAMFFGGEIAERYFGPKDNGPDRPLWSLSRYKVAGAATLLLVAAITAISGQPSAADKWEKIQAQEQPKLAARLIHAHPAEVVELKKEPSVNVVILDVRSEQDFNLFHLRDSKRVAMERIGETALAAELGQLPANTVIFLISNNESRAVEAWKLLTARRVPNLYVIEGGVNRWLELYPVPRCIAIPGSRGGGPEDDTLEYRFSRAVGSQVSAAHPEFPHHYAYADCEDGNDATGQTLPKRFERKVKIEKRAGAQGGCG